MRNEVSQRDALNSDQGLSCACRIAACERIEHASGTSTTRLFLLLRADVDVPPNRVVDGDVLISDIRDFSTRAR